MSNKIDPSADDNYMIRIASKNGDASIVEILLKNPNVNPAVLYNYQKQNLKLGL